MTAVAEPLLAKQVIVVEGRREHYYKLPSLVVADVVREHDNDSLILKTPESKEFEQFRSAAFCINFAEDAEKAIALRNKFQDALTNLAEGLTEMMRYDKALEDTSTPSNPLTPTVVAAEDPERGAGIDPQTWKVLQTGQENWFFFEVERIEVLRHIEISGEMVLIPKGGSTAAPVPFGNAFTCESDEEWENIKELSNKAFAAQKAFLGHLASLETYYNRSSKPAIAVDMEVLDDEDPSSELVYEEGIPIPLSASLLGVDDAEAARLERILLELQLENQQDQEAEDQQGQEAEDQPAQDDLINEDGEEQARAVIQFLVLSQQKRDQALWLLKYKILKDKKSSVFGGFDSICKRLYLKGIISFQPNTAREYAFGFEERRQLVEAKIVSPEQHLSVHALLGIRQLGDDIEKKKEAVQYSLAHEGSITRKGIDAYRDTQRTTSVTSRRSATSSSKGTSQSPPPAQSSNPAPTPSAPAQSSPSEIVAVSPKEEIKEGDLVEALPGAKYIGGKEILFGTKGTVHSVNQPPKQCCLIPKDNPEETGYVLLEHLKKVAPSAPEQNYSQVVEQTSHEAQLIEERNRLARELEEKNKLLEEQTALIEDANKRNNELIWRFQEMAVNAEDMAIKTVQEAGAILQKYEEEFGITDRDPDVRNCVADLWEVLRRVIIDPVEDKILNNK